MDSEIGMRSVMQHVFGKPVAGLPIPFFRCVGGDFGLADLRGVRLRHSLQRLPATDLRQVVAPCPLVCSLETFERDSTLGFNFLHIIYDDGGGRSDPNSHQIAE